MENITSEQFEQYRKALKLNFVEDLDSIIKKYNLALIDYYYEEVCKNLYDLEHLNLIVTSFKYFTSFDKVYEKMDDEIIKRAIQREYEILFQIRFDIHSHYDSLVRICLSIASAFTKGETREETMRILSFPAFEEFKKSLYFIYDYEQQKKKTKTI